MPKHQMTKGTQGDYINSTPLPVLYLILKLFVVINYIELIYLFKGGKSQQNIVFIIEILFEESIHTVVSVLSKLTTRNH